MVCVFFLKYNCAFSEEENQKLLIHHNLRRLIKTHITITNESFGVIREHFIIVAIFYMFNAFFRQPIGHIGGRCHFRNVIAMLFT